MSLSTDYLKTSQTQGAAARTPPQRSPVVVRARPAAYGRGPPPARTTPSVISPDQPPALRTKPRAGGGGGCARMLRLPAPAPTLSDRSDNAAIHISSPPPAPGSLCPMWGSARRGGLLLSVLDRNHSRASFRKNADPPTAQAIPIKPAPHPQDKSGKELGGGGP